MLSLSCQLYLGQEVLTPPAALVVLLDLGPALDDGVVLGQELLPLVLPELGRGNVQVNMVTTPEKLITSEIIDIGIVITVEVLPNSPCYAKINQCSANSP